METEPQLKIKQLPEKAGEVIEDAHVIEGTPVQKKPKQPTYEKTCEVCDEPFTSKRAHSKTCSTSCRSKLSASKRKNKALGNSDMNTNAEPQPIEQKPKEFKKEKKSILPSPHITGLPPHLQMAFDLLKENARRFEEWYEKELAKREDLEKQLDVLQDQLREKQTSLQGLMDEKPTLFERILGSIPQPFIEATAPHFGALMGKISGGGVDGTNGQLDEASAGLLQWIGSLPEQANQNLMTVLGTLMQLPEAQRDSAIASVVRLLTETPMQKQRPINVGMFGS